MTYYFKNRKPSLPYIKKNIEVQFYVAREDLDVKESIVNEDESLEEVIVKYAMIDIYYLGGKNFLKVLSMMKKVKLLNRIILQNILPNCWKKQNKSKIVLLRQQNKILKLGEKSPLFYLNQKYGRM